MAARKKTAAAESETLPEAGEVFEGTPEQISQLAEMFESLEDSYMRSLLENLAAPFHGSEVKTRTQQGTQLDYVPIDAVIRRFLEAAPDYQHAVRIVKAEVGPNTTSSGKPIYVAVAEAAITAFGITRAGLGAGENHDLDTAVKTADAEAFKKAANKFGVALELWDPEARAKVALWRKAAGGDETALKQYVFLIAKEQAPEPPKSAKEVAAVFGLAEKDLSDVATLKRLAGIG